MSRTPRPLNADRATVAIVLLISQRVDKPCPTREELMYVTGLQRRRVWPFIEELKERGLIEVELRGEGTDNVWRRMRVFCGQWTDWTERKPRRRGQLMLEAAGGC